MKKRLDRLTDTERLTEALILALTAPGGREIAADALVQQFAAYCSDVQIAEAMATAMVVMEARSDAGLMTVTQVAEHVSAAGVSLKAFWREAAGGDRTPMPLAAIEAVLAIMESRS